MTHEHFDHIENLEEVRRTFNVPVVASQLCSERIKHVVTNLSSIADILAYYKTGEVRKLKPRGSPVRRQILPLKRSLNLSGEATLFDL